MLAIGDMPMRKTLCLAAMTALLLSPAQAQDADGATPRTPQDLAMAMFDAAGGALASGDYETARRMLEAALDLKPGHPAILQGLLTIAVRAGNADDGFDALERMAEAGISIDPARAESLLSRADPDRFAALSARIAANAAPAGHAEIAARIDRPGALIEGVAMDIETDRLFVSSVTGREILMLEPFDRDTPIVFANREDGLWSVFGLAVDDRSRMVWAGSAATDQTPMDPGESVGTALFAFDLVTGDLYRRYTIDGAVRIADFTVRDGIVYASDSGAPRVYVLDSLSGQLQVLAEDPRFVSLQGVALARGALYVADYAMGIWRIDLGDHSVSLVRPGAESLIGLDGLRQTRDGRLLAVRNGTPPHQVMAIDLDRTGRAVADVEILLRGQPDMMSEHGEPTLIDPADGRAWLIANAAWPLFPGDGEDRAGEVEPVVVLELDLP